MPDSEDSGREEPFASMISNAEPFALTEFAGPPVGSPAHITS